MSRVIYQIKTLSDLIRTILKFFRIFFFGREFFLLNFELEKRASMAIDA